MSNPRVLLTETRSEDGRYEDQIRSATSEVEPRSSLSALLPAPPLASGRYNRQMLVPQVRLRGQGSLLASKVLIIGLGGLGSPASLYLAGAGIGTLGLMDGDAVEISNLHRQIVHTEFAARLGQSKVQSAATRCRELNPEIVYVCHEESASASNILDIVSQYDLVLDCTDNPATRYLISDACVVSGKVLVSGAAQRGDGMLIVLNNPPTSYEGDEKGPCYRCVFPRPPAPETVRGCSEIGILGPVVGVIGTLMAGEAIKIITSGGHISRQPRADQFANDTKASVETPTQKKQHTMLLYNTYASDPRSMFRTIGLRGRRKDCVACGDDQTLATKNVTKVSAEVISHGRLDYRAFCGVFEDVKLLDEDNRIHAGDFLRKQVEEETQPDRSGKQQSKPIVVDVREEHEYELGPKVRGSLNIPISHILRHGSEAFGVLGVNPGARSPPMGPDGGMIDQESHIPVITRHDSYPTKPSGNSDQIPPGPARETQDSVSEEQYSSVYFVCQRGNDSQIAAQKLIEKIEADAAAEQEAVRKKKWGWIGDVKGGIIAMERHARTSM
ncbi:Adenylyltransferase and sulfurtransferase uba4 [Fonsecaea pedrosoi]|nr:Adenylyltransferase and sulfurtransferase uba4 [Fonsecaea pedrosoi]